MSQNLSESRSVLSPADLEIRVTTRRNRSGMVLDFVLHSPNNRLDFFNTSFPSVCLHQPDEWQKSLFKTLEKLHDGFDSHDTGLSEDQASAELAALGEDLYQRLFPADLRRVWWRKVRPARTIFLVSGEPWIPWEIVKPHGEPGEPDDDENGFLATCFQLTRWLLVDQNPPAQVAVARLAAIQAADPPDLPFLKKTIEELHFLQDLAGKHSIKIDELVDPTHPDVVTLLSEKDLGLLHFAGHGEYDKEDVVTSGFCLHDGRKFRPRDLRPAIRSRLLKNRSLIFLNACESGRQGQSLTSLGGWPQGFLDAGCGAFIAPQWSVNDDSAHLFATTFYGALESGKTFGEAALDARQALPSDSLDRLAYSIYSHPNGRLSFETRPQPDLEELATPSPPVRKLKAPRRSGLGVSRSLRARSSGRRSKPIDRWRIVVPVFLLLATVVGFQIVGPSPWKWQKSLIDESVSSVKESTEFEPISPARSLPSPVLDIHLLQKPPYRSDAINFILLMPPESSDDPDLWRSWVERTAEPRLVSVGLQLTRSTNAGWLVALEFEEADVGNGTCTILSKYEIYRERQSRGRKETFSEKAKQFNDDAACQAAIQKITERIVTRLIAEYFGD